MLRSKQQQPKLHLPKLEEAQNKFNTNKGRKRVDLREDINETESRKVMGKSVKHRGINMKRISPINEHLIIRERKHSASTRGDWWLLAQNLWSSTSLSFPLLSCCNFRLCTNDLQKIGWFFKHKHPKYSNNEIDGSSNHLFNDVPSLFQGLGGRKPLSLSLGD